MFQRATSWPSSIVGVILAVAPVIPSKPRAVWRREFGHLSVNQSGLIG